MNGRSPRPLMWSKGLVMAQTINRPGIIRRIHIRSRAALALALVGAATLLVGVIGPPRVNAAVPTVSLGTAANFAILAGSTVTNTGATTVSGDLGLSPGTSVTGFPPGQVVGTRHVSDAAAVQAKNDLAAAYNDVAARVTTAVAPVELGGTTKTSGVYESRAGTF